MSYFSNFIAKSWLNDLEGQRSLHGTHPLTLVTICAKYEKNPSKTVCAVQRSRQDVPYFSSFIANSSLNDLEDIGQGHYMTPSHASDHLCLIWKELIQNCRNYRANTACGTDGRTEWNQYTPPHNNFFVLGVSWHNEKSETLKAGCAFSAILVKSPIWFQLFQII